MGKGEIVKLLENARAKRRGYADHFDWPEKSLKEWGIIQTFFEEIERDCGPLIASGMQHPGGKEHLAPDYRLTTHSGELWGVEITELIDQEAVESTKRGQSVFALWNDDDLKGKLLDIVTRKDTPAEIGGGPYTRYILLVHVDEYMLPAERLSALVSGMIFQTHLIDDIYVLVSYDPQTQRYPLIKIPTRKA